MRRGLNFRQKITLSHILLFFVFALFAFPFIEKTVSRIVFNNVEINSLNLLHRIEKASNEEEMIAILKKSQGYYFLQVSLFNDQGMLLYDSAREELNAPLQSAELKEALQKQIVFSIGDSADLKEKLAYVKIAFELNGRTYILRTAIPFSQVEEFAEQFKAWFFAFCALALLFLDR